MTIFNDVITKQLHHSSAMKTAERWLMRMEWGDVGPEERQAFEHWLETPQHAAAYREAARLWQDFGRLEGTPALSRLSQQIMERTAPSMAVRRRKRRILAVAAAVAVSLLSARGLWIARVQWPTTYSTQAGERSAFRLADGSQVILNSATDLEVKLGPQRREFVLRRGEVVFTVADDAARPFVVSVADSKVTALGTRFQVRNDPDRVVVTLIDGRVAVKRDGARHPVVQLEPSQQLRFSLQSAVMDRRTVDAEVVSSWTVGRLRFKHTAVSEVLEEVNRYSKVQIQLTNVELRNRPVNATFDIGDSASVVSALKRLLGVDVLRQTSSEIVLALPEERDIKGRVFR